MKRPQLPVPFPALNLAALVALGTACPAAAEIRVAVNGQPVPFASVGPQRIGGRVLIPLRAVVEALGAEVKWDRSTQTVLGSKGERTFALPIGSRTATVNGAAVNLDVPAQLISGNTMVPLRFVAEALGAEVEWNAATQEVAISNGAGGEGPVAEAGRVRGEVVSVQPGANPTITVRNNGVRETYRLAPDAIVLRGEAGRRGTAVDLEELRPGDTVSLRVNADRGVADVVEAYTPTVRDARDPRDRGNVDPREARNPRDPRDERDRRDDREVRDSRDARGPRDARNPRDVRDQRDPGDVRNPGNSRDARDRDPRGQGPAVRDDRDPVAGNTIYGEVIAVRPRGDRTTITVQTRTGRESYDVPRDAEVLRSVGRQPGRQATPADVKVGDRVRLTADRDGVVTQVNVRVPEPAAGNAPAPGNVPAPASNRRVTGVVVSVRPGANPPTITVRTGTSRAVLEVTTETDILRAATRGGRAQRATLDDIQPGDQVRVRTDPSGTVAEVIDVDADAAVAPGAPGVREVPGRRNLPADPGAPVGANLPAAPAANLRITSFAHSGGGMLREGSTVRVTLTGTPGAMASFDAGTVAKDVRMTEDPRQPGRYEGTFSVPRGVTAKDVPVIAQLRVGNQTAPLMQAGTLLNVDSEPPHITEAAPAANAAVANQQPDIYAELSDGAGSGLDLNSLRMTVGGRDVTDDVKVTPRFLLYTPHAPLPAGPVPVTVSVKDLAGNEARASWSFTVAPAPAVVQSVTHNGDRPLRAGDELVVTVKGQPGGRGTFRVGELAQNLPLRETEPGTYVGRYVARQGDEAIKAPVSVDFTSAGGQRVRQSANVPVNVATAAPRRPTITAPVDTVRLQDDLVVQGTAAPGSKVRVEVLYAGKAFGALPVKGTFGAQEVTADRTGRWTTEPFDVRLPLGVRRPELSIQAVSVDGAGTESDPVTINVTAR